MKLYSRYAQVQAEMSVGSGVSVRGTPTWFVNGRRFQGAQSASTIRDAIDAALEAAEEEE